MAGAVRSDRPHPYKSAVGRRIPPLFAFQHPRQLRFPPMGAASAYMTAVVAGAMTAGIGAASVLAVPEPDDSVAVAEADLAAITDSDH